MWGATGFVIAAPISEFPLRDVGHALRSPPTRDMIHAMPAFCLSLHAAYRCRHAGACCRTWTVPAEDHVLVVVGAHGLGRPHTAGDLFLRRAPDEGPQTWNVARDAAGECVFLDNERGRLCLIHEAAGPDALPSACRHFPRIILRDGRGSFISLSHFCPTAAGLLLHADPLTIVEARPPLRLEDPVEGLDATDALPPLVRPGILTDLDGYAAWERAGLTCLGDAGLTWSEALDRMADATERVRVWRPGTRSLREHVEAAFDAADSRSGADPGAQARTMDRIAAIAPPDVWLDLAPIDRFEERWAERVAPAFPPFDRAMKNYLAARLFGAWIAYQGRGLRTIVEWLRTCAALVRYHALKGVIAAGTAPALTDLIEAVRLTDLLLLHALDTHAFARHAAALEEAPRLTTGR